jgi:cytochrome c1
VAAGKQVFASNGCGSCHTFEPAGSSGTTGPDLDELPDLAENANQPLANFTRTAITDPTAYVEEGFPEGVMPAYDQLSEQDLNNLVAFLTQS